MRRWFINTRLLFLVGILLSILPMGRAQPAPSAANNLYKVNFEFYPDPLKATLSGLLLEQGNYNIYEDRKQRNIIAIYQEQKPLNLVFVFGLGADATCSVSFEKFVNYFIRSLGEHVRERDKITIFSTTESSDKVVDTIQIKAEKASVASLSLIGKKLVTLNLTLGSKKKIVVCDSEPGEPIRQACYTDQIILQSKNYWGRTSQIGIEYLRSSNDTTYRNALILVNSINNIADLEIVQKGELGEVLRKNNLPVSWIGKPLRQLAYASPSHFSYEAFLKKKEKDNWWSEHVDWEGSTYFESIVSQSGGQIVSCEAFSPASTIFESSRYKLFSKGVGTLISRLRNRYKIIYESDNPDLTQPRSIKLEMSPKWKGGKVTLHYPKIIYPQTPEK